MNQNDTQSDALLQGIFKHQLMLAQEIKKRLGDNLDEALQQAFDQNEIYLQTLLEKSDVTSDDLQKLQQHWQALNAQLGRLQPQSTGVAEEETDPAMMGQGAMAKLYSDS